MDWIALIFTFLDPLLVKCLAQFSADPPKEYLLANYDAVSGRMDPGLVEDSMRSTMQAVRHARRALEGREERRDFPRYSREELYSMTERRLIEAMNAPVEVLQAAMAAVAPPVAPPVA